MVNSPHLHRRQRHQADITNHRHLQAPGIQSQLEEEIVLGANLIRNLRLAIGLQWTATKDRCGLR